MTKHCCNTQSERLDPFTVRVAGERLTDFEGC